MALRRRRGRTSSATDVPILEGSTFCICDDIGDVSTATSGLFAEDTRFLSRLVLTLNGAKPLPLSAGKVEYFSAAFFLRNPPAGGLRHDQVAITRERFVGEGMQDVVVLENESMDPVTLEVAFDFAADFADILSVKQHDFALGDPEHASPLPAPAPSRFDPEHNQFVIEDPEDSLRTQVILSRTGQVNGSSITFPSSSSQRALGGANRRRAVSNGDGSAEDDRAALGENAVCGRLARRVAVARPNCEPSGGARASFRCSPIRGRCGMRSSKETSVVKLPAAGMPWFMTVFGRDTLITCLQTLLFGPELARNALAALAELQADEDDPSIDAEPGKIVHEVRNGKAAKHWFHRYYGTLDATPLYLILFSEVWRWTGDVSIIEEFRQPALKALEWIDRYGDRDGDGFVEFQKRATHGLDVQSWKDSHDSQRFHDGRTAQGAIAPCEVQGYVYDAKRRLAEIAREAWRDRALAERLDREAEELKQRFDEAFWCEDRGGFYALALDGEKNRVDSICSNMGHLLWSQIVPPERVDAVVDQLMGDGLWSGWGVRTMSRDDAAYSPLSYHNGTVWPHDNSLIAWGLARYERWPEAHRIVQRTASRRFDHQLPEVFAGPPPRRRRFRSRIRPRASAGLGGGTPVLLLRCCSASRRTPGGIGLSRSLRPSCRTGRAPSASPACARSSPHGM
jgi:glycogen debranching enzyme